jgi:tellurite resistance protein TehA-like permease
MLERILASSSPGAGAQVMGTGIVSIGLSVDGRETLSRGLLVIASVIWVGLAVLLSLRAARDPTGVAADARSPASLTAPIATAVLGARMTLLGWTGVGVAALALALGLWLVLFGPVRLGWTSPTVGASLLLAVSPEAVAVIAAAIAEHGHARWLLLVALASFGLGLVFYVFVISRFDFRELASGRGDHWITGGALGIAALAAATCATGASTLALGDAAETALKDIAVGLWVLTMVWLSVLVYAEFRWPRPRYDTRRWSTVFPLGMYAACSFAVGAAAHADVITSFARIWVWVGLAAWALVFIATLERAATLLRVGRPPRRRTTRS